MFENIPNVKLGLIAVSRDCFPRTLSEMRRANIAKACEGGVYECPVTVENENDMLKAVADVKAAECNALVVFLGNFGPETPETLIAKYFDGPCMFVAAAEGDGDLINGRGDAYCGMLNCSYNLGMRHLKGYIPEYPVGTAEDIAKMIADFIPIARAVIGVKNLKIITFGPRPQDFFACNAPIKGLYELGVEIEENSELDLLVSYKTHAGDARIPAVCEDMKKEMGEGKYYADMLERMAQFELTLLDWAENHKGARKYVAFADKCWPAFPEQFGFEPCYVNSRLASHGIPVACEVDIYGALSEYIGACISHDAVTLLDINNSVPASLFDAEIKGKFDYMLTDTFMAFHCGNTPSVRSSISSSSTVCSSRQAPSPTSPAAHLRQILRQAILRSIASSAIPTVCFAATLQRVKFCRYIRAASAASASSPSRRWAASTVMCSSRSATRTTARSPSVTTASSCSRSSSSSAWATSPTISRNPCRTPRRIHLYKNSRVL